MAAKEPPTTRRSRAKPAPRARSKGNNAPPAVGIGKVLESHALAEVRGLARILRRYDLSEIEVEQGGGQRLRLRRERVLGPAPVAAPSASPAIAPAAALAVPAGTPAEDGTAIITSPFVGTFYRAPAPEAAPFVDAGQTVKKGQVLCIVEAMKLMNEIEAESACKIVEILGKNGEPVEFGQPLFRVFPLA